MSERIHALAQRLFGKASVEECDLQQVKSLAQRFPYFAPAQFLLLEKLKQENATDYSAQLQKCILYYHNPLEFQYFISPDRFYTEVSLEEEEVTNPPLTTSTTEEKEDHEQENVLPGIETQPVEEAVVVHTEFLSLNPELKLQTTSPEAAHTPAFEPYHTVDYFASQGIKLSVEEAPKDKFGKQLKSFTEWLKTMKRLSPTQMPVANDTSSENRVQNLAEDSIHDASVWTEAMAEVWAKQGNIPKAIEVYNKLSLLNPSKKAYFATKIENLKRS